jgi:hypothetical protein
MPRERGSLSRARSHGKYDTCILRTSVGGGVLKILTKYQSAATALIMGSPKSRNLGSGAILVRYDKRRVVELRDVKDVKVRSVAARKFQNSQFLYCCAKDRTQGFLGLGTEPPRAASANDVVNH